MHSCMLSLNNLKGTSTGNHSFDMQQKHSLHVSWACSCHQFREIPSPSSHVMTLVRLHDDWLPVVMVVPKSSTQYDLHNQGDLWIPQTGAHGANVS